MSATNPQKHMGSHHGTRTESLPADVAVSGTGVRGVVEAPAVVENAWAKRDLARDNSSLNEGSGPRSTRNGKSGSLNPASLMGVTAAAWDSAALTWDE